MCPLSSTEEVIALFISIAFVGDALKGTINSKFIALNIAGTHIHTRAVCNILETNHSCGFNREFLMYFRNINDDIPM